MSTAFGPPKPAMVKKKFPMADVHLNSSIQIQMDDVPRLKSEFTKNFADYSPS